MGGTRNSASSPRRPGLLALPRARGGKDGTADCLQGPARQAGASGGLLELVLGGEAASGQWPPAGARVPCSALAPGPGLGAERPVAGEEPVVLAAPRCWLIQVSLGASRLRGAPLVCGVLGQGIYEYQGYLHHAQAGPGWEWAAQSLAWTSFTYLVRSDGRGGISGA